MTAKMEWSGVDDMIRRMQEYANKVQFALVQVANYWKAVFEAYAKENASWTDRTGNARQTLHGWVNELSNDTVELYLSHGVDYGLFLETKYAGKYSIVWPTIEAHLEAVRKMLQGIFG